MTTIRPVGDYILVRPEVKKTVLQSEEGMLCEYGEVMAMARGLDGFGDIHVGSKIAYSVFGVEKVTIDDEKFYLVTPAFILGAIE